MSGHVEHAGFDEQGGGQGEAFRDWVEEELRPALEAGGAKGVYFSHMSDGERDGLFANWDDMVNSHSVEILSYRADLSY